MTMKSACICGWVGVLGVGVDGWVGVGGWACACVVGGVGGCGWVAHWVVAHTQWVCLGRCVWELR